MKIKLTIEENPSILLNINIMIKNGVIETSVGVKESKIPNQWSSAVFKKYKRNAILGDLQKRHPSSNTFELGKELKNILALILCTISFNLVLIVISKNANP